MFVKMIYGHFCYTHEEIFELFDKFGFEYIRTFKNRFVRMNRILGGSCKDKINEKLGISHDLQVFKHSVSSRNSSPCSIFFSASRKNDNVDFKLKRK
jgi:hypothetical protein